MLPILPCQDLHSAKVDESTIFCFPYLCLQVNLRRGVKKQKDVEFSTSFTSFGLGGKRGIRTTLVVEPIPFSAGNAEQ